MGEDFPPGADIVKALQTLHAVCLPRSPGLMRRRMPRRVASNLTGSRQLELPY
jgi:hypothetical protein